MHSGGVEGLFRGCQEVLGGIRGCLGCVLCQKWLRLSIKVDECKPLLAAGSGDDPTLILRAGEAGGHRAVAAQVDIASNV
jgi:hypothetical protein